MKKTVEITDEELELLKQVRAQKAREEAAARLEAERLANKAGLEAKFREAMKAGHEEINGYLQAARDQLELAVKASEKYGVPFSSYIVEMGNRRYVPSSFKGKWGTTDRRVVNDVLEDFDLYISSNPDIGWEYWNTSSLSC